MPTVEGASRRTLLSWSSGKDSAWALHLLRRDASVEVVGLFTTVNAAHRRVAMHAVRLELLHQQAAAAGLPLTVLEIPYPCSNDAYAVVMQGFVDAARADGVACMAFGDLFLEDVRRYREEALAASGIEALFPLWQLPTRELLADMLAAGVRAHITCVDPSRLPQAFAGRELSSGLLDELPAGIDPCGENGEFHTFVSDGPMFARPVPVISGEVVERDGFVFADLLPDGSVLAAETI